MTPNAPVGLACRRLPPSAELVERVRPFDGWQPDPADPTMDPVDRVVGRACADLSFRSALLANPAAALAAESMPLALKRLLVGIRAGTLDEFATRALVARDELVGMSSLEQAPPPLRASLGSLAGVGV
jgi:hypothetical protein